MYNTLNFLELKIQPAINSRLIPPHARSSGGLSPAGGTTEGAEGVAPTPVDQGGAADPSTSGASGGTSA